MPTEERMTLEQCVAYAKRVARNMWKDPEADSFANFSAWYAHREYDGRIPEKRWIAACVKRNIWHYWRKLKLRRAELKEGPWLAAEVRYEEVAEPELVDYETFELLWRKHVEGWCMDVIARRYGWTMKEARAELKAASERLRAAHERREGITAEEFAEEVCRALSRD